MNRFWSKLQPQSSTSVGVTLSANEVSLCVTRKGADGLGPDKRIVEVCTSEASSPSEQVSTLKQLLDKHDVPKAPVTLGLSMGQHKIYALNRPQVEDAELAQSVTWLLKDRLEQAPEETLVSVIDYPPDCRRDDQIMAIAIAKDKVRQQIDVLNAAGLEVGCIDVSELLLGDIMQLLPNIEQGLALLVEHDKGVMLLIYRAGYLYLFRNLAGITDLMTCLPSDTNRAQADQLMLEVQRTLDYYDSQMRQPPLAGIIVAPTLADLSPLVKYLDDNLAASVELLDMNLLLNLSEPLSHAEQLDCLLAAGAAFREESPQ